MSKNVELTLCNLGGHPLTPFNRAKLLNVGFKIASAGDFDCFFFSDIDLFRVLKIMFSIICNFRKFLNFPYFAVNMLTNTNWRLYGNSTHNEIFEPLFRCLWMTEFHCNVLTSPATIPLGSTLKTSKYLTLKFSEARQRLQQSASFRPMAIPISSGV